MANTTGTNFTQIGFLEESTYGVVATGQYKALRYTGESLVFNADTIKSQELRADRQVPDLIRTGTSTGGDLNVELSYGAFDELIAGAMYDVWTSPIGVTEDCTISLSAGPPFTGKIVANTGSPFTGMAVGDWFRMSGWTTPASNDTFYRVDVIVTPGTEIDVTAENLLVNENNPSVTTDTDGTVRIGSNRQGFSIEKGFNPGALGPMDFFHLYNGVLMSEMEFSVATGSILTGRFGTIGLGMATDTVTTSSPSALVAAPTADIYNAVDSVKSVLEGGAEAIGTLEIQSLNFTLNNNIRALQSIGVDATGIPKAFDSVGGTADLTGSMTVYFTNNDFINKFVNFTSSSFSFRITDQAGNTYIIDMPRIRYSAAPVPIPGIDQDVFVNAEFTATIDATIGNTLSITRIAG